MTPRGETGNDFGVRPTAEGSAIAYLADGWSVALGCVVAAGDALARAVELLRGLGDDETAHLVDDTLVEVSSLLSTLAQKSSYANDPEPPSATCGECGGTGHWIDSPTAAWWAHDIHPEDNHDFDAAEPPKPSASDQ